MAVLAAALKDDAATWLYRPLNQIVSVWLPIQSFEPCPMQVAEYAADWAMAEPWAREQQRAAQKAQHTPSSSSSFSSSPTTSSFLG